MKILAVLNRDGGTLKTTDLDWLKSMIEDEFRMHGHNIEVLVCPGDKAVETIRKQTAKGDLDVLLVGGGDGTVSAAAAACSQHDIALAILPAGTMNLFARTLQIPLDLPLAVQSLAAGQIVAVDMAAANDNPFVHQFAVGLHARMVRMREGIVYRSRIGKIFATSKAVFMALKTLPVLVLTMEIDGESVVVETPAAAFSNNFYGDGHIPYADNPTEGVLGVYICKSTNFRRVAKLTFDIMRGNWRSNHDLQSFRAQTVRVRYKGKHHHKRAVRDGELEDLASETVVEIRPGALKVLVPADASFVNAPG